MIIIINRVTLKKRSIVPRSIPSSFLHPFFLSSPRKFKNYPVQNPHQSQLIPTCISSIHRGGTRSKESERGVLEFSPSPSLPPSPPPSRGDCPLDDLVGQQQHSGTRRGTWGESWRRKRRGGGGGRGRKKERKKRRKSGSF